MKRDKEEAKRWLGQSEYAREAALTMLEQKIYSYACFLCEQAAQKALKAYLFWQVERYIWEHSIRKLAERCSGYQGDFIGFIEHGSLLDRYYLTTRYPSAVAPPALPYESFIEKDAHEALDIAGKIIDMVKRNMAPQQSPPLV